MSQCDKRDKCDTPPNEYISNPPQVPPSPNGDPPPFAETIVSVWNEAAKCGFKRAHKLQANRLAKLKLRVKEFGEETLLEGIRRLSTSDWHTGKSGDWRAGLGWYLNSAENVNKALEFELPAEKGATRLSPDQWLAFCEERVRAARRAGNKSIVEEWEAKEREARACLPQLQVVK